MTTNNPSDAEFEEECRVLDALMGKILGEDEDSDIDDTAEQLAAMEVARKFYIKYRDRLEADGIDVTAFLRDLDAQVKVYGAAVEAENKAIDNHLQARANLAELEAELVEKEFLILRYLENMTTGADWAAQPPEQQKQIRDVIEKMRNVMPEYLASLPIEKRHELEGLK